MKYEEISPNQSEIFNNLMKLCNDRDAFYYDDLPACQETNSVFRVFNYRMARYTDFCEPSALECRGIMFEVSEQGEPLRLASRPNAKFFNANENPMSMLSEIFDDDPKNHIVAVDDKADGSYINSYIDENRLLALKSKGHTKSVQAVDATQWIDENNFLHDQTLMLTQNGWTVNFEWCTFKHRHVLLYSTPHLQFLNVVNNETGEIMSESEIQNCAPELLKHQVKRAQLPEGDTMDEILAEIDQQEDIEGYIIKFDNGLWVKAKTEWYKTRHHCKDSVTNPRRLFELCVSGNIDDVRGKFSNDEDATKLINDMELFVTTLYNKICQKVEDYYAMNKHLDQKSYATKAKTDLGNKYGEFNLAMSLYNGKEVDYKTNLVKRWKQLGLEDTSISRLPQY